jgi:signal transduction histidine kinase
MTIFSFIPMLCLFVSIFLFTYVYAQNSMSKINRAFLLFSGINSLYLLKDFIQWSDLVNYSPEHIVRGLSLIWLMLGVMFYNFVLQLLGKKRDMLFYTFLFLALLSYVLCLTTDLVITGYSRFYWGVQTTKEGPLSFWTLFIVIVVPAAYCTWLLYRESLITKNEKRKKQFRISALGTLIFLFLSSISGMVMPVLFNLHVIPEFAAEFAFIQLLFIYIAVVKYNFLSVEITDIADNLFANLNEGIVILDEKNFIIHLNTAAKKMLHIDEKVVGNYFYDYFSKEYDLSGNFKKEIVLAINASYSRNILISQTEYIKNNNTGRIILLSDLTKEKEALKQKDEMQKQFFQASKLASVGELASGVAHEINNPLMVICGHIEIMDESVKEGADIETINNNLVAQMDSVKRIASIVDGLRTYARSDKDKPEVVDVNDVVEKTLSFIDVMYSNKGIKLIKELSPVSAKITGFSNKLQQVILNLLSNSKDAVTGRENPEITVSTWPDNDFVYITVKDNGIGIPKENLYKVFDSFFTTKEFGKGTGLGLSISYSLVEAMGGKIFAESEVGVYTKMIIKLPCTNQ